MGAQRLDLFGGSLKWIAAEWTSSDDRVRGGKSQSYLDISDRGDVATFKGNLDIKTLGGAGFASQRTASDDATWDLNEYDGLEIVMCDSDAKQYTFNVKDTLLSRDPNTGREQSTISYEFDFRLPPSSSRRHSSSYTILILWKNLNPTYRGREKRDAPPLKTKSIRRFGIMCRSFFGEQEGELGLEIERISAVKLPEMTKKSKVMDAIAVNERSSLLRKTNVDSSTRKVEAERDVLFETQERVGRRVISCLTVCGLVLLTLFVAAYWWWYCMLSWWGHPPVSYRGHDGKYYNPPLVDRVFCGMRKYEPNPWPPTSTSPAQAM